MSARRFPPPWSIDDNANCFIVKRSEERTLPCDLWQKLLLRSILLERQQLERPIPRGLRVSISFIRTPAAIPTTATTFTGATGGTLIGTTGATPVSVILLNRTLQK
jgi:hypothetical protein